MPATPALPRANRALKTNATTTINSFHGEVYTTRGLKYNYRED